MQTSSRIPRLSAGIWLTTALLVTFILAGCTTSPSLEIAVAAPVPAPPETKPDFARWVDKFSNSARAAGISNDVLHQAFDNVRFVPRVVELDRSQPEFNRPVWEYLDSAISKQRIAAGKAKLLELQVAHHALEARYGVPLEVLVAIWGIESNFGRNMGDIPTIDALATLGFEGRRAQWAAGQLLAALKILQNGDIGRSEMIGSWAGAMGQTQFLPSAFLNFAVDFDGDGRRDIWGSVPDVMASTANFLAQSGWKVGQPWGLEVLLPPGFDYFRAASDVRQSTSKWVDEGVRAMDGGPIPALDDVSVLLPAGARGPALLVGANFRTVLQYNNATSYALAVNLLAQRLTGGPAIQAPWPRDLQLLTRSQLQALQTALNAKGFNTGTPDGLLGPATQGGVRLYQRSMGLPADGYPTVDLLERLIGKFDRSTPSTMGLSPITVDPS